MFSKPIISLGALVLATVASAKPIPSFKELFAKRGDSHSFNGYGGYSSMSNFDDFYGSSDFSGISQTLVEQKEVVCKSVSVEIVQQQLAVIREWYKKIITEQICEVEVQTIVHDQFSSGCDGFSDDLRRKSSRHVSYDHEIASHIVNIHDSSSECVTNDLGFSGYDVGSNAISYSGDNWNSQYSPSSVDTVWGYCQQSYGYSAPSYSSSWQSSYSPPSYTYSSSGYEAPSESYGYTYEAPPTYTSDSSYGYGSSGYSYEAPPSEYTSVSSYGYGYSYEAPPPTYTSDSSYGYGSSGYSYEAPPAEYTSASSYGYGYAPPSSSCDSCDVSSNVTDSSSWTPSSDNSTDSASVPAATDSSVPISTDAATSAAATDAASTSAAASSAAATDASAASSAPAATASA